MINGQFRGDRSLKSVRIDIEGRNASDPAPVSLSVQYSGTIASAVDACGPLPKVFRECL